MQPFTDNYVATRFPSIRVIPLGRNMLYIPIADESTASTSGFMSAVLALSATNQRGMTLAKNKSKKTRKTPEIKYIGYAEAIRKYGRKPDVSLSDLSTSQKAIDLGKKQQRFGMKGPVGVDYIGLTIEDAIAQSETVTWNLINEGLALTKAYQAINPSAAATVMPAKKSNPLKGSTFLRGNDGGGKQKATFDILHYAQIIMVRDNFAKIQYKAVRLLDAGGNPELEMRNEVMTMGAMAIRNAIVYVNSKGRSGLSDNQRDQIWYSYNT